MKRTIIGTLAFATLLSFVGMFSSCTTTANQQATAQETEIARGADLGWLSEMEHDSMRFYRADGSEQDCMQLLKDSGCNAVRLRVWVNHETGWSNLPDVLAQAERVRDCGLRLMIDLHYSDFFADPAKQAIPAHWLDLNFNEMCLAVAAHTTEVLQALKDKQITPEWVQIGNETTYGTLWPMGKLDKPTIDREAYQPTDSLNQEDAAMWKPYARLSNAGYEAAKQVFPNITCIVHVDNAFVPRVNWFKRFQEAGGKWDMIGLSHYPFTQDTIAPSHMNDLCVTNVKALHETYHCDVMVVEIGTASWEHEAAVACIHDYQSKMQNIAGYAGVFYWEPEVYAHWRPAEYIPLGWGSYEMGAFTHDGKMGEELRLLFSK